MEIVLVRHAQPMWVRDGLNVVDPPLTELGERQAEHLVAGLADEVFDEVRVSPLMRARQTAGPTLTAMSRAEEVDYWLEEIRDPKWHGTPAERAKEAYEELYKRPAERRWDGLPGGESTREFVDRMRLGAQTFLAERGIRRTAHELPVWEIDDPNQRICLIAHAGTNSVTICHLLGLEPTPWEWDRFVLGHASISRIEALSLGDGFTFSLTKLSDVAHLPDEVRTR